jgi:protein TonB
MHVRTQVMPQLPQLAKALGIEKGHVVVVLHVDPRGTVERVELVEATPPQVYDQAMEQAFRQWTFDPLGVPGRMKIEIEVKPQPAS